MISPVLCVGEGQGQRAMAPWVRKLSGSTDQMDLCHQLSVARTLLHSAPQEREGALAGWDEPSRAQLVERVLEDRLGHQSTS